MPEAEPIRGDAPESFAWRVLHERHPALLARVREALPYEPAVLDALDLFATEIESDVIRPLADASHDHARWQEWARPYLGARYSDVPFLWAENFFYRKLLGAVGYFAPGPWQGTDPFGPVKRAELTDPALAANLAALDDLAALPDGEQDAAVLHAALWGNRADLGFLVTAAGARDGDATELVADDSARLWEALAGRTPGTVCLVADNAGRELLSDLVLVDHLLTTGRAEAITLHVKPSPYFTSDATMADLLDGLGRLRELPGRAGETGRRVWRSLCRGRIAVRTHDFWTAPLTLHDLPDELAAEFSGARLTILKGDLNYRRLVGDAAWPAAASFDELTAYFPGPVATLRTLKCDVVAGVEPDRLAALDAATPNWRVDGGHALVQVRA